MKAEKPSECGDTQFHIVHGSSTTKNRLTYNNLLQMAIVVCLNKEKDLYFVKVMSVIRIRR